MRAAEVILKNFPCFERLCVYIILYIILIDLLYLEYGKLNELAWHSIQLRGGPLLGQLINSRSILVSHPSQCMECNRRLVSSSNRFSNIMASSRPRVLCPETAARRGESRFSRKSSKTPDSLREATPCSLDASSAILCPACLGPVKVHPFTSPKSTA